MRDEAHITVQRGKRYADCLRAYRVEVDGVIVASVRARQSVTFPVSAGRHALRLRIDCRGSEEHQFEAQSGEGITFKCGSSLAGWFLLIGFYDAFLRTQQYLWLRRAGWLMCFRATSPSHALERTPHERRGCDRGVPRAGSLSSGRWSL